MNSTLGSVVPLAMFNNYDYNEQSTELSVVKTWAGPVSASQLPLFSEYTKHQSLHHDYDRQALFGE